MVCCCTSFNGVCPMVSLYDLCAGKYSTIKFSGYSLLFHCPISTATTHIGSSCACSYGQGRFGNWSRPIKSSSSQPPQTNHTNVSSCHHCDDEVVIHLANGHLILITRLVSLLTAFTQCAI